MKLLVLGASGMLGHIVSVYLKDQGHNVIGFVRRKVNFVDSIQGNAYDLNFLSSIVDTENFDAIINCIGILNQYAEENKQDAVFLNSFLPHYLAHITENKKTKVVQISTDCVFSGKSGGYTETSFRDGATFYDRTKALGELEDGKNLTLRNSIIGPDIDENGIGLLNWFMKSKGPINGYTHAIWTGMTTLQTAKVIEKALASDAHGLYNMVPSESISKYDLLKLFNHYLRNDSVVINKYDDFVQDKTLIRTRFDFDYVVPGYETMIKEMADWINRHSDLYPCYYYGKEGK